MLLIHGEQDHGVPVDHVRLLEEAATEARGPADPPVEVLILPEFGHRWLYEDAGCRRRTAEFLATALGGPVAPAEAGERAAGCVVERPPDPIYGFGALANGYAPARTITPN